jgi:hypothetical protein
MCQFQQDTDRSQAGFISAALSVSSTSTFQQDTDRSQAGFS